MVKLELIKKISDQFPKLPYSTVKKAIDIIIENMMDELSNGGHIEIRNFGSFSTRRRKAIMGRNPQNGKAVLIKARHVVHFRPSKEMKERLNVSSNQYPIKTL